MNTTTEHPYERWLRNQPAPMTADDLARDIAGTNNGYLFAPTGEQLKVARENPDRFTVAYGNSTFPYRISNRDPLGALAGRSITEANDLLRQGVAGFNEAAAYVEAWNATPGRFTVASLQTTTVHVPGCRTALVAPYIHNQ